jgi:hypothetical protein
MWDGMQQIRHVFERLRVGLQGPKHPQIIVLFIATGVSAASPLSYSSNRAGAECATTAIHGAGESDPVHHPHESDCWVFTCASCNSTLGCSSQSIARLDKENAEQRAAARFMRSLSPSPNGSLSSRDQARQNLSRERSLKSCQ